MLLHMANRPLQLNSRYLDRLRSANDVLGEAVANESRLPFAHRLDEDGYMLMRGLIPRDKILAARRVALESLAANDQLDSNQPLMDGVLRNDAPGAFLGGRKALTHTPEFLDVVESPEIMRFFELFLGGAVLTYDYKWFRAVAHGQNTGAHYDIVYMGRGTRNLYTAWIPFGDVSLDNGPLAILAGSHRLEQIRHTYGEMDVDRDKVQGWFSNDPYEMVDKYDGQWLTSEFAAGDVLIFGMYTMHASLDNETNRIRLSSDTRYQLASEPVDERWIGDDPKAHYAWHDGEPVLMSVMREKWGV